MAPRKSKAKKATETMRQKQMRLRREAQARKTASKSQPALPPGKKGGALAKTTQAKPENPRRTRAFAKQQTAAKGSQGGTRVGQPSGSANRMYGANVVDKAVKKAVRAGKVAKATKVAGRVAVPLGIASEIKEMSDRAKRDAERNKKLGRRPFEELRADSRKGNTGRRGQGGQGAESRPRPSATPTNRSTSRGGQGNRGRNRPTPTKRPVANLPADYKKTEAQAFKKAEKSRPARQNSSGPSSRPAAAKPKPKPQTSGVGPVASGRTYSVKKTGKSVMQQQAAELKKMGPNSEASQRAREKAKQETLKKKKKQRQFVRGPRERR